VALALIAIGLYGVLSYAVARRTREIAIRRALGATDLGVLALVMRQGLGWVIAGIVLGTVGAFLGTRLLSSFLFGVATTDTRTYGIAAAILACVGALAAYLPVRRAARIDPVIALSVDA
jgi:putative ABC transport system permease protein